MSTHSDFTDNGRYACVYNISQAQVWDVEKKRLLTKYVCNDLANPITAAALAQFNKAHTLLIGYSNGEANLLSIETNTVTSVGKLFDCKIISLCWMHKTMHFLASSQDGKISEWDCELKKVCAKWSVDKNHTGRFASIVKVSMEDDIMIVALAHTIKAWSLKTQKCILKIQGYSAPIQQLNIAFNSKVIIACAAEKQILLWGLNEKKPVSPLCILTTSDIPAHANIINLGHKSYFVSSLSESKIEIFRIKAKNLGNGVKSLKSISNISIENENIIAGFVYKNCSLVALTRTIVNLGIHRCSLLGEDGNINKKIVLNSKQRQEKSKSKDLQQTEAVILGETLSIKVKQTPLASDSIPHTQDGSMTASSVLQQALNSNDVDNLRWIIKEVVISLVENNIPIKELNHSQIKTLFIFLYETTKNDPKLSDCATIWLHQLLKTYCSVLMKDPDLINSLSQLKSLFDYKAKDYTKFLGLKLKLQTLLNRETSEKNESAGPLLVYEEADEEIMDENITEYVPMKKDVEEKVDDEEDMDMEPEAIEDKEEEKGVIKIESKSQSEEDDK